MAKMYEFSNKILITSDDRIACYDLESCVEKLVKLSREEEKRVKITCLARSAHDDDDDDEKILLVVAKEDKNVEVLNENYEIICKFVTNRVAHKCCVTKQKDIIIADKTGDVYLYDLYKNEVENCISARCKLLLGHQSIVLDFALTECEKYLITCDRDEKIRISHYPNCYNIFNYCLGHTEFVINLFVIKNVLISASGDGTVRLWNFLKAQQLNSINTNDFVKDKEDLLKKLCQETKEEKINNINALPVTNLQVYTKNDEKITYLAVSLYNYKSIQLYCLDMDNCGGEIKYLTEFNYCIKPTLVLLRDKLYTYSNNILNVFRYNEKGDVKLDREFTKVFENYEICLFENFDKTLSALYKRKYDNVQEYMERKKQRLELK